MWGKEIEKCGQWVREGGRWGIRTDRETDSTCLALEMSGKAGGKFMEGQVCPFSGNRERECSNQSPVSPNHARPETSRTWRTCWNSQAQHYSRNVGWWLLQYGCVRHSSVRLHALVLINTLPGWHSAWAQTGLLRVMKHSHIHFSSLDVQCFFPSAILSPSVSLSLSIFSFI